MLEQYIVDKQSIIAVRKKDVDAVKMYVTTSVVDESYAQIDAYVRGVRVFVESCSVGLCHERFDRFLRWLADADAKEKGDG